jgi:hypothetical protein
LTLKGQETKLSSTQGSGQQEKKKHKQQKLKSKKKKKTIKHSGVNGRKRQ